MPLSMVERETIILFNEGEKTAEVFTNNDKVRKKLEQASARHPEIYRHRSTDQYGGVTYEFRKKWLTVVFREPVTAERSEKLRQQAIKNDPLGKYIKRTARNSENN